MNTNTKLESKKQTPVGFVPPEIASFMNGLHRGDNNGDVETFWNGEKVTVLEARRRSQERRLSRQTK